MDGNSILSLLTLDKTQCGVWVVPMGHLREEQLAALLNKPEAKAGGYTAIAAFRPTGWTHQGSKEGVGSTSAVAVREQKRWQKGRVRLFGVAYSEHSSFTELCECVLDTWPFIVTPTVDPRQSSVHLTTLRMGMRSSQPYDWGAFYGDSL